MNEKNHYQSKYKELSEKFITFFKEFDALKKHDLKINPRLIDNIEHNRQWIGRLRKPEFLVAFLGSFSAGKSTVINAILNRYVLPESTRSTTAVPTYIRKGNSDRATVHYISDKGKQQLIELYAKEIEQEITDVQIPLETYHLFTTKDREDLLSFLNDTIKQAQETITLSKSLDALNRIEKIITHWDKHQKNTIEFEGFGDLKSYVTEQAEDILFVDRAEIFVKDIDLPTDVVLVDLPGLNVANKRHQQVTRNFIEKEAKAFIVCMKPMSLLEGEEITFLDKINKTNSSILERAFWVINQWDKLSAGQRKQEENNFRQKTTDYKFKINDNKFFKVSALEHLLCNTITKEHLDNETTKYINNHKDILLKGINSKQINTIISEKKQYEEFPNFHSELFNYLNFSAKEEFLDYGKLALKDIKRKMLNILEPLVQEYNSDKEQDLIKIYIADKVMGKRDKVQKLLLHIVEKQTKEMRLRIIADNFTIWGTKEEDKAIKKIKEIIKNINKRDLCNELSKGTHLNYILARLPEKVEKREIPNFITDELVNQVKNIVYKDFSQKLLTSLRKAAGELLPKDIDTILEDKLSNRDLENRIRGLADYLLYFYGLNVEKVGEDIAEKNKKVTEKETKEIKEITNKNKSLLEKVFSL